MRPILILTLLFATLATCLIATESDAGECRGGSCSVARFERIRIVERGVVKKTRSTVRVAIRGR
jgi:hypothetical protein